LHDKESANESRKKGSGKESLSIEKGRGLVDWRGRRAKNESTDRVWRGGEGGGDKKI
jgi:hypothetical protein